MKWSSFIVFITVCLTLTNVAWAALPQTINNQGYLRNSDGTPVNTTVSVLFSVYTSASGGTALWSESREITPADGVYSHQLASVTPFPAALFANDNLWLGVKVGGDPEMTPREQMTTVPFAFRSATADNVGSAALTVLDGRYDRHHPCPRRDLQRRSHPDQQDHYPDRRSLSLVPPPERLDHPERRQSHRPRRFADSGEAGDQMSHV